MTVRARLGRLAALVAVVALLGACTGREPTAYNDEVRDNFVAGCMHGEGEPTEDQCTCTYERVSQEIPFDQMKQLEDDLVDGKGTVPPTVSDAFAQCAVEGPPSAGSSSSSTSESTTLSTSG